MGELLAYTLKSGIVLLALYLAYRLWLSGEKQHAMNRCILMGIYAVSFGLFPLLSLCHSGHPDAFTHPITIIEVKADVNTTTPSIWPIYLIWVYVAGMAVVTFNTLFVAAKIMWLIQRSEKRPYGRFTLVVTNRPDITPFSWLHYMVMSRKDFEEDGSVIANHELQHLRSWHWVDLVIAQVVIILEWWNPAAWLMRREVMANHEYQADMGVLDSGIDLISYQQLLIRKAVGARFPSLTGSLNHSSLKNRFTMMYSKHPGRGRRLRALVLVPALLLALAVVSTPQVNAALSAIRSTPALADKVTENTASDQDKVVNAVFVKNEGSVIVTLTVDCPTQSMNVADAKLFIGDKEYSAKIMSSTMADGDAMIMCTFPTDEPIDNARMTVKVNNQTITVNANQSDRVGNNTKTITLVNGASSTTPPVGVKVYLNDKEITWDDMNAIDQDEIENVVVDKGSTPTVIHIFTKK